MGMDREEGPCCPEINKEKDEGAEQLVFSGFIIACKLLRTEKQL